MEEYLEEGYMEDVRIVDERGRHCSMDFEGN